MNPGHAEMTKQAPDEFRVKLETSKGDVVIAVTRSWAPHGADRFYNLVRNGYYDECRFFRVVSGFVAQFGMNGNPEILDVWADANMPDDPVKNSNKRGTITYAKTNAPNSRSTQLFINFRDNSQLDGMGFAPFGEVVEGMDVIQGLYADYGDGPPTGRGPDQSLIRSQGNAYLKDKFPKLDYVKQASIVQSE